MMALWGEPGPVPPYRPVPWYRKVRNLFSKNPPSLGFEPLEPYSTTVGALGNHAFRLPSTTREAVQFELFIVISCAADEIKR